MVEWLQDGAPGPTPKDPVVTRIDVFPKERIFEPDRHPTQNLVIQATWSDGVVRDVTPWARLSTLNDAIAALSPAGVVKAAGRGETSIMVRYGGQATVARMSVPFARLASARAPAIQPANYIDE